MKNRKKLDEKVSELRKESAIVTYLSHADMPDSNANVFRAKIMVEMADFTAFLKAATRSESEINEHKKPVVAAVGLYNDEMRMQRLESLCKMSRKEAWADYMRTQCVTGYALCESEEEGWYIGVNDKVRLQAEDFMANVCYLEYKGLVDMACILVDNIAKAEFKQAEAKVSKKSLSEGYIRLRDRNGWNIDGELNETTRSMMAKQMTEICTIVSDGVCPKMVNADVLYLKFSCIHTTDSADSVGEFVMVDEKTILRALVRAMYTRCNGLAYEFQSKGNSYKGSPLSVEPNKDMNETAMAKEFAPEKIAEAGAVTVVKSPEKTAKKSTTKKSTTKKAESK